MCDSSHQGGGETSRTRSEDLRAYWELIAEDGGVVGVICPDDAPNLYASLAQVAPVKARATSPGCQVRRAPATSPAIGDPAGESAGTSARIADSRPTTLSAVPGL